MIATIAPRARRSANCSGIYGIECRRGFICSDAMTPPRTEAQVLTTVTPTWTVARNLSGFSFIWLTMEAERLPSFASFSIMLLFADIMAISALEKKPLIMMSMSIIKASNTRPSADTKPPD